MISAAIFHSFCDLCGNPFRQYVTGKAKRHTCERCIKIRHVAEWKSNLR